MAWWLCQTRNSSQIASILELERGGVNGVEAVVVGGGGGGSKVNCLANYTL